MDNKILSEVLGFDVPEDCEIEIDIKLPNGELSNEQLSSVAGGGGSRSFTRWGGMRLNFTSGNLKSFDTSGKLHDKKHRFYDEEECA